MSFDDSGSVIEVKHERIDNDKIDKKWTYFITVNTSSYEAMVHGIKIKFSTK